MGSKTRYYTALDAQRIFDDSDNLYTQEMLRAYSYAGARSADEILKVMVNDSISFFNEKVFKKFGVSAEVDMLIEGIPDEAMLSYIKLNVDNSAEEIIEQFTKDNSGKYVFSDMLKLKDHVENDLDLCVLGTSTEVYQYLNGYKFSVDIPDIEIDGICYSIDTHEYNDDLLPDVYAIDYCDDEDETCDHDLITTAFWSNPDGDEYFDILPEDTRVVIAVIYRTDDGEIKTALVFRADVIKEAIVDTCLLVPLKIDNEWVGDDKYTEFVFSRFGLGHSFSDPDSDLYDQLDQDNLRDSFITYSAGFDMDEYKDILNDVYGNPDGGYANDVTISSDDFTIVYTPSTKCTYWNSETGECETSSVYYDGTKCYSDIANDNCGCCLAYSVTLNRETLYLPRDKTTESGFDEYEQSPMFIIPVKYLQKLGLKDKYLAYQKLFSLWVYFEKKVKVSWWQSTFFRFLLLIVGAIFAAVMYGAVGLMNMAVGQISSIVMNLSDPRIGAAIGIAIGFAFGTFSGPNAMLNIAQEITKLFNAFRLMAFRADLEQIQKDTENYSEETREMAKEINEMKKKALWMPLDFTSLYYDSLYQMQYAIYPGNNNSVYNYDNLYRST